MDETIKKNPVKVFRCGPVRAAIWSDSRVMDNSLVELHSVKITRSYKDKDNGEWKHTPAFNAEDLPKVALVAMEAYKFIRLRSPEPDRTDELSVDSGPQDGKEVLR